MALVVYELKHPFRDGTTHVLFEPLDFVARLAALVPRPRAHLVRYHGLFAPNAKHRHHIVVDPTSTPPPDNAQATTGDAMEPGPRDRPAGCNAQRPGVRDRPQSPSTASGGTIRVIAAITDPALIARILPHRDAR